jgi:hypothetical protein
MVPGEGKGMVLLEAVVKFAVGLGLAAIVLLAGRKLVG